MEKPVQVTFRNLEPSAAIEADVREKVAKLEEFFDGIIGCRVVIEEPHRSQHQGKLVHVRVDVTVPGKELVVSREPTEHHAHEDAHVAVRDAFRAMKRQLEDHARVIRGDTKRHEEPPPACIARLFPADGYGFIETGDGREIYFHRNALVDQPFERLTIGDAVRFVEEAGEQGPQASTVHVLGHATGRGST
jgi:cold shock CspA family protein/ribosome-associated translation inhibitor RaiA